MSFTYEQYDVLHNFISPVTGRVLADFNYVLVGNKNGIAMPSPILIDIRLDLIALRKRYNSLVKGDIIIGHPNNELPNAQVLFNLANGYLYNTEGIVSINTLIPIEDLPDLPYQNIWIGDITNRPVPQQRVGLENLPNFRSLNPFSNFGLYGIYTGKGIGFSNPLEVGTPSITQRIDMSNMPHLSKGKMWIGKINYIPPYITIDSIFPYVHVVGSLNWSAPGIPPGPGDGVPIEVGLNPGEIFIGDPNNPGEIITSSILPISTLPDLPAGAIWRGDSSNRPAISYSLGQLETRVTNAENSIIALQGAVGQLEVQIGALQLQVGALDTALGLLTLEVQTIAATVAGLSVTVTGLGITVAALGVSVTALESQVNSLSNRTLDQIPLAIADVNLNGHKIINLSDPINPLDAVNLQTLQAAIDEGTISSVSGTANQITANTVTGAVTLSLPNTVIINTSVAAGNMELNSNVLKSNNTNGNISISPNGSGKLLLLPSPSTGMVGIKGTPSYPLDVFGALRAYRLIGGTFVTATVGVSQVTGSGSIVTIGGSEIGGNVNLTTGTGITNPGTDNPLLSVNFTAPMPNGSYSIVVSAGNLNAAGLTLYVRKPSSFSQFFLHCTSTLSDSTGYVFNYVVIAN